MLCYPGNQFRAAFSGNFKQHFGYPAGKSGKGGRTLIPIWIKACYLSLSGSFPKIGRQGTRFLNQLIQLYKIVVHVLYHRRMMAASAVVLWLLEVAALLFAEIQQLLGKIGK